MLGRLLGEFVPDARSVGDDWPPDDGADAAPVGLDGVGDGVGVAVATACAAGESE